MKITFVYPGITLIGFNSLGGHCHDSISVNLGMAYMSSFIKKNSNHSVDLIDLRELKSWDCYEKEIIKRNPDIVGIHCNTVNYDNALRSARIAKKMGKIVIMGGPHATFDPSSLIDTGLVDSVIVGEGEVSFLKLVNDIERGVALEKIICGERIDNLDEIPFPDRDIYNMERILNGAGIFPYPNRYVGVIASRGCCYNCSFCQPLERKIFGQKLRTRSVSNIIEEVKDLIIKYEANFIMFECDTLTTKKDWTLDLCKEMKNLGVKWGAQSRADTIDEELAKAMHEAGCMVLFIGFESGSSKILNLLRKGITPEDSIRAAKVCRKNKILIFANYMFGVPTETKEDLDMTYKKKKKIRPELHSLSYFAPIPGSDLYDYCKDRGLIEITSYEGFVRNPVNKKVKGVDYELMNAYKAKLSFYTRFWWTELHFAQYVFLRWSILLRKRYYKEFIFELFQISSIISVFKFVRAKIFKK